MSHPSKSSAGVPSTRQSRRVGNRYSAWLWAAPLLGAFVGGTQGCSPEMTGIDVGVDVPEPNDGFFIDPDTGEATLSCEEAGISCGTGCCAAGQACSATGTCLNVGGTCDSNNDCSAGAICGGSGTCEVPDGPVLSAECRNEVQLAGIIPVVQCQWPGPSTPAELGDSVQVMGTPMVVDFNLDNDPSTSHPSIVFISHSGIFSRREDTAIRVIDGQDCSLQFTFAGGDGEDLDNPYFLTEISTALGDIDGDGTPDILAATSGRNGAESFRDGLAAYSLASGELSELWYTPQGNTGDIGGIAIHDLDNDDIPEILTSKSIFDATGDEMFSLETGGKEAPMVMDIMDSPAVEIITNQGIFNWNAARRETEELRIYENSNLTPLWTDDERQPNMFVAGANLVDLTTQLSGGADSIELVMVGADGSIIVTKADGISIHRIDGTRQAGGPAVIADFDGDGRMEFGSAGLSRFTVYDLDCKTGASYDGPGECLGEVNRDAELWSVPVQSQQTAASVFDFDGDGRAEVVYADQCFLRIYDGTNGDVLFSIPRSSLTKFEYPVVADVDGDSFSELITGSNDANDIVVASCQGVDPQFPATRYEPTHGITVWADPNDLWAGSRPIWNQHTYNVNNVLDDGTIPAAQAVKNSWNPGRQGGPNTFRQNIQGETGASVDLPDITVSGFANFGCLAPNNEKVTVTFEMCNYGPLTLVPGQATAALSMSKDGGAPSPLGLAQDEDGLEPGVCRIMPFTFDYDAANAPFDVTITADPGNSVDECAEQNNTAQIVNIFCQDGPD